MSVSIVPLDRKSKNMLWNRFENRRFGDYSRYSPPIGMKIIDVQDINLDDEYPDLLLEIDTLINIPFGFKCEIVSKLLENCEPQRLIVLSNIEYICMQRYAHLLGRAYTLQIPKSNDLKDVSTLNRVKILSLCNCPHVVDVKPLANLQELYISDCIGITDVSSLRLIKKLAIRGCPGVVDLSGFLRTIEELNKPEIYELEFSACSNIRDATPLSYAHILNLSKCIYLKNVRTLGGVHSLNLSGCTSLTDEDILPLFRVEILDIKGCYRIFDLAFLSEVQILFTTKYTRMYGQIYQYDMM
jgi:hypothetical protein